MKIQIASDLHLNLLEERFPAYRIIEPTDADILVIAGDIHHATRAIEAFSDWPVPVIYVHGNHEAYHEDYADTVAALRCMSANSQIHYLEQDELILGDVRFLGCCLWTDYQIGPADQSSAMQEAGNILYDHRLIRSADGLFSTEEALQQHREARLWLESKLAEPFAGRTVVITHHGPHPGSIAARFAGTTLNAAFVSDLTPLMGRAGLWIHGHVHDSFDYEVNGTRIVTNPRGYALNRNAAQSVEQLEWENPNFNPTLVLGV